MTTISGDNSSSLTHRLLHVWRNALVGRARMADLGVSAAVVVLAAALGAWIGARHYVHSPAGGQPELVYSDSSFGIVFLDISGRNISAALLAFSGVATFGVSTLAALVMTGAWVGATGNAAISEAGLATIASRVFPYFGWEISGLALAATAGVYPAIVLIARSFDSRPGIRYGSAVETSLRLLVLAVVMILLGAGIESGLIMEAQN